MLKKLLLPLAFLVLSVSCCGYTIDFGDWIATPTSRPTEPPGPTAPSGPPPPPAELTGFDWQDRSPFAANLVAGWQPVLDQLPGISFYNLSLVLGEDLRQVNGLEEIYYTNRENAALDRVWLGLFPELLGGQIAIGEVRVDDRAVTPEHSLGMLAIPLEPALPAGQAVVLHIEFQVSIPAQGGNFYYGIFGYNRGILSLAHAYPTVLVYNAEGWNNEIPDDDGDPLFSDTSLYLVTVNAPASLVLVASGREIERSLEGDRQRAVYANGPARDFYLAASPDFTLRSQTVGDVTVRSYYLPGEEIGGEQALDYAAESIRLFSARYGSYPYSEFDVVPIVTTAGGVEYPGLTAINADMYTGHDPYLEVVIAHEVGHQWFYNLVGNDTQDEPYLDESLTQFVTCQYFADRYGRSGAEACWDDLQSNWDYADDPESPIGLSVDDYSGWDYVSIIYGKGAFFFDALRERMGEAVFDAFLRDYAAAYAWEIGDTAALKRLAETHCNCDLTGLFEQWVYP
ncbi:MAG: M1 family metallopeptidase [Anaerolineales bacterium]|nr:M1 family metallopeptidase [Anaerolineales bacterium]